MDDEVRPLESANSNGLICWIGHAPSPTELKVKFTAQQVKKALSFKNESQMLSTWWHGDLALKGLKFEDMASTDSKIWGLQLWRLT